MNHIYKSIFNKALGVFTAVPEFASAHGKGSERTVVGRVAKGTAGFAASALAISVGLALTSTSAVAAPGIFINNGQDPACLAVIDDVATSALQLIYGGSKTIYPAVGVAAGSPLGTKTNFELDARNPCLSTGGTGAENHNTQTNRTLFYNNKNLTLGGRLDVNSGIIGVGDRGTDGVGATNSIRMGTGTTLDEANKKTNAISIGVDAGASADNAIAMGKSASAAGQRTIAMGENALAGNEASMALGYNSSAKGLAQVSIGQGAGTLKNTTDSGAADATFIGNYAGADSASPIGNMRGIAVGTNAGRNLVSGVHNIAVGYDAGKSIEGSNNVAIGYNTGSNVNGDLNFAGGREAGNSVKGEKNIALGYISGQNIEGNDNTTVGYSSGNNVTGWGNFAGASKAGQFVEGYNNVAIGYQAGMGTADNLLKTSGGVSISTNSKAKTSFSIAIGDSSSAGDDSTGAHGGGRLAIAIGQNANANFYHAIALGHSSRVSPATGQSAEDGIAIGSGALVDNYKGIAVGAYSRAKGRQSTVIANNVRDSNYSTASGDRSQVYGAETTVSGNNSVAIGDTNTVASDRTYAIGNNINAAAGTPDSLAFGTRASVGGASSIALGSNTKTYTDDSISIGSFSESGGPATTGNLLGTKAIAIGYETKALATSAVALGYGATVENGHDSIAIGVKAKTSTQKSTTIGSYSEARGDQSTVIANNYDSKAGKAVSIASGARSQVYGAETTVSGNNSVAIGDTNTVAGARTYAIGNNINVAAGVDDALAFGTKAAVGGANAIALGNTASAAINNAIAVGQASSSTGNSAIAIGTKASAQGDSALAHGVEAQAIAQSSTAIGFRAKAQGYEQISIGSNAGNSSPANAENYGAVFIGRHAGSGNNSATGNTDGVSIGSNAGQNAVSGIKNVAIGPTTGQYVEGSQNLALSTNAGNSVKGDNNLAMMVGAGNNIEGGNNIAIGTNANSGTPTAKRVVTNSIAMGANTQATSNNTIAIGPQARALAADAVALGLGSLSNHANSVALGAGSVTSAAHTGDYTLNTSYTAAGQPVAANGTVSVGSAGKERQIQNVAAGVISATSTDAINGSQLYATNNYMNNFAGGVKNVLGGDAAVDNAGNLTMSNIGGTGKGNVHEAIAAVKGVADTAVQEVESENPTALSVKKDGTKVTLTPNFITGDLVNADGTVNAPATADEGKLVSAKTVADALKANHFVVDTKGNTETGSEADAKVGSGNKVTFEAGNNLVAKQANTANGGATVKFSLKDDISLNSVTAGTGANQVVLGNDGVKVGGNTYINNDGLNANSKVISNVADGVNPNDAVNKSQLDAVKGVADSAVKSVDTVASEENLVVDNNDPQNPKLRLKKAVNLTSIKLDGATPGNTTYVSGYGLTIEDGPSVKKEGINAGDKKITNVAAGDVSATSKDAVNGAQLHNVASSVANVLGGNAAVDGNGNVTSSDIGGTGANTVDDAIKAVNATAAKHTTVVEGKNVKVTKGKNAAGGDEYTVATKDDLDVTSVTAGNTTVNTNGLTITGGPSVTRGGIDAGNAVITNVRDGKVEANSKDAVNGGQLHATNTKLDGVKAKADTAVQDVKSGDENALTTVKDPNTNIVTVTPKLSGDLVDANGNITAPTTPAEKGKLVTAGTVAQALANTHFVVDTKATDGELDTASQADQKIKAGNKVTLQAGKNLKAKQTNGANGAQVEFSLKDSISLTQVTAGDSTLNTDGLTIAGGPSVKKDGINAGDKTITNVAPGAVTAASKDAVNGGQLYNVANNVKDLIGPDAAIDPATGKVTVADPAKGIGETGKGTIGEAIKSVKDKADTAVQDIKSGDEKALSVTKAGNTYTITPNLSGDLVDADGNITAPATDADKGKLVTAGTVADALANTHFVVDTKATDGELDAASQADQKIKAGNKVTLQAGKNLKAKQTNGTNGAQVEFSLKDSISLTQVTAGDSTLNTDGLTIAGGPSVKKDGINAGDKKITNVAPGAVTPTSKDAVNGSQLYNVADNVKDLIGPDATIDPATGKVTVADPTQGIAGTGKGTIGEAIKSVKDKADTAVQDIKSGDEKALSVTKAGNTYTITPNLSGDLVDADGNITAPATDADKGKLVTAGTVAQALANTHFVVDTKATDGELDGASEADQKIKAGNKVTLQAGKNLKAKQTNGANGAQVEFSLKDSISLKEVTAGEGDNQVVLGNDGVKVGGNTYINKDGLNANNKVISNVADGVNPNDAVNKGQLDAVGKEAAKHTTVKAGKNVEVTEGTNAAGGKEYTVKTADNLDVTSVKAGDSTLNTDGLTIAGGPSVKKDGINAGDKKITNVAPGAVTPTSKDAVNGSQLYNVANNVKDLIGPDATIDPATGKVTVADPAKGIGETGKGNIGDAIKHVNDAAKAAADTAKKHTTVEQGDNILVEESLNADGGKHYKVSTARDLNVDSVKAGDTTVNNDGVTIAGGPSVTKGGINAGGNTITNVADGVNDTDAVNKGQLDKVAQNVVNVLGGNATVNGNGDITMSNIGDTGKGNVNDAIKAVNDLAKKAAAEKTSVKAKDGRSNVTVTEGVNAAGGHEYTVDVERAVTEAGSDQVTVTSKHDADSNTTTYTVDVSDKTKASLAKADSAVQGLTSKDGNLNFNKDPNGNVEVSFNDNLNVKNVTTDRVQVANGPSMTKDGINAAGKAISNVANGNVAADSKDAVNGGQLYDTAKSVADVIGGGATVKDGKVVAGQNGIGNTGQNTVHGAIAAINQNTANNFNQIRGDLRKMDRDLRGGIAGALATAGLPQAFRPGKSMVAAAASTYRGQSGLAIGVSRISDNGKIILKVTGNTNSRGDFGGTIGAGYQW